MRWTVSPWGGSFHSDGQHVPAGWLRSQNLRKICESVLSVHTLPLFSLRAHTAPCWPGWAGFPRQLQVASGATKSPPSFSFEAMSGLTVTAFCLLGIIIYPCISLLVGVPQVFWVSLIISYLVWDQLLVPGDSYLAFISVTWQVEGWERALGAPSPWHTEYCLCSLQHPLKRRVPVNFSHLREGSCIQQAARFQLCVYFSKRPEWYKWHVFHIFNIQICKELWGLNSKYMMSCRCLIYIV